MFFTYFYTLLYTFYNLEKESISEVVFSNVNTHYMAFKIFKKNS